MSTNINKWVVYEFRKGEYAIIGKPQATRQEAEKLRDKLSPYSLGDKLSPYGLREKRSFGVGRVS